MFTGPKVLIMENPFIGLDAGTRDQLKALMDMLAKEQGLQIILVLAKTDEIPDFITHIVEVKDMHVLPKISIEQWKKTHEHDYPTQPARKPADNSESARTVEVINFKHVSIRYGERTILKDLDWTVYQG